MCITVKVGNLVKFFFSMVRVADFPFFFHTVPLVLNVKQRLLPCPRVQFMSALGPN